MNQTNGSDTERADDALHRWPPPVPTGELRHGADDTPPSTTLKLSASTFSAAEPSTAEPSTRGGRRTAGAQRVPTRARLGTRLTKVFAARRRPARESRLGLALERAVRGNGVIVHDLVLPDGHTIIDHTIVVPAGVWVVRVEQCSGRIELRNVGSRRAPDMRLYIGGRDRTLLVAETRRCAGATRVVLDAAGQRNVVVHRALCLVNAEWERMARPHVLDGVHVTWGSALVAHLGADGRLTPATIAEVHDSIVAALRSAMA